ncbi:unnamed protein product, partial [Macrosiphum euphorbiae]
SKVHLDPSPSQAKSISSKVHLKPSPSRDQSMSTIRAECTSADTMLLHNRAPSEPDQHARPTPSNFEDTHKLSLYLFQTNNFLSFIFQSQI